MTTSQRAVVVKEVGKPLELGTRPIPKPNAGDDPVKVSCCMLLPHDTYSRDLGLFTKDNLPFVPASNVAGTINQIGPGVTTFQQGDHVFGYSISRGPAPGSEQGGLQEYAILDADAIGKIPAGFTDEQAVTLPTNLVTAWQALYTEKGFGLPTPIAPESKDFDYGAETVLVLSAGSSIGKFAVQIARLAGIGKIIAVAGPSNEEELRRMGATQFFNRHLSSEKLAAQILGLTGRDGIRYVFDCYSSTFDIALAVLSTTRPSVFRTTQPMSDEQEAFFQNSRPLCDATFIEGTNASLRPYASVFWGSAPLWLLEGKLLPTRYRVLLKASIRSMTSTRHWTVTASHH